MIEVELKAALTAEQAAHLPMQMQAMGFSPAQLVQEIDVYLNGTGERDFRKTDEALRLRTCRDLEKRTEQTLVTYKGPKLDARSSTRTEYETSVGELEVAEKLLQALGFAPMYRVDKVRQTYTRGNVTVCQDRVEGLGPYMELEILQEQGSQEEAVDELLRLLDSLQVSREALTRTSYLELLIRAKQKVSTL